MTLAADVPPYGMKKKMSTKFTQEKRHEAHSAEDVDRRKKTCSINSE